jgi:hypothetical protein
VQDPIREIPKAKRAGGMAHVVAQGPEFKLQCHPKQTNKLDTFIQTHAYYWSADFNYLREPHSLGFLVLNFYGNGILVTVPHLGWIHVNTYLFPFSRATFWSNSFPPQGLAGSPAS